MYATPKSFSVRFQLSTLLLRDILHTKENDKLVFKLFQSTKNLKKKTLPLLAIAKFLHGANGANVPQNGRWPGTALCKVQAQL